jgi:hypothetical protein
MTYVTMIEDQDGNLEDVLIYCTRTCAEAYVADHGLEGFDNLPAYEPGGHAYCAQCDDSVKHGANCFAALTNELTDECPEEPHKKLLEQAGDIGSLRGKNSAGWVTDGNTTRERYAELLRGIEECDPMVLDSVREPSFSGEYADDYSEADLARDLGVDGGDYDEEGQAEIVEAYLDAARSAFWDEIERVCRVQLKPEYEQDDIREAHGWLGECFEDTPEKLTDEEVVAGINRHYSGGWNQFVADSKPYNV